MRLKTTVSYIVQLFCILSTGCQNASTAKPDLQGKFLSIKPQLDSIVYFAQQDKKLDSAFWIGPDNGLPPIEQNYPLEYSLLKRAGITDAASFPNVLHAYHHWYYLRTDWQDTVPVYLVYNLILDTMDYRTGSLPDSSENQPEFYKIDKYGNETWGQGGKWKIFRLVHTIDDPVK